MDTYKRSAYGTTKKNEGDCHTVLPPVLGLLKLEQGNKKALRDGQSSYNNYHSTFVVFFRPARQLT
jgi:hypothetical protein